MKKLVALLLAAVLCVGCFAGCGNGGNAGYEIALITDKGNIDDKSFNQGAWEGVVEYAEKNNISHKYYKPEEASDAGYYAQIELAVQGGAKVVVTPGYLFEVAVYQAQTTYPDVKFILLDGAPHTADYATYETKSNVASVMYAEEESGYLAGYAAVMDGNRSLGFMGGMAVPAVQAFGYGYLQGIDAAAKELGLADGEIKMFYHYTGDFAETDANKQTAKGMYASGAEVIFSCGGSVGKSVMSAAAEEGKKVIGVDVDQRYDSETVITSAMKGLSSAVQYALGKFYAGNFSELGGIATVLGAANDAVGLPTDTWSMTNFTVEQYNDILAQIKAGTITVDSELASEPESMSNVTVEIIE